MEEHEPVLSQVRRAIALDPNYATAHKWLAEHLMTLGRLPEAIVEARTTVQLDPLAQTTQNTLGLALWYAGKIDEAVAVFRAGLARDSTAGLLSGNLFLVYLVSGRTDDALALLQAQHDTSTVRRALVRARSDPAARAAALDELRKLRAHLARARMYALLGEREAALSELDQAVRERDPRLELIKVDPTWASLRGDPRFARIVARVGLPP